MFARILKIRMSRFEIMSMRLVKVSTTPDYSDRIMRTAFECGVKELSIHQTIKYRRENDRAARKDVIDIETSTPTAKRFIEKLLSADYFDPDQISFNTRQPRSFVADVNMCALTYPIWAPSTELCEELWQFSHVTYGLIIRVLVASCLLAYGLIENKLLLIVAGLLFLPVLPMLTAISYGLAVRQWELLKQGSVAVASVAITLFLVERWWH